MMPFFSWSIQRVVFCLFTFFLHNHLQASGKAAAVYEHIYDSTASNSGIYNVYAGKSVTDTTPSTYSTSYYVSNSGQNFNNGTSQSTPKLNLDSIESIVSNAANSGNGVSLNLDANSIFREQFDPYGNGLNIDSYNSTGSRRLAKISGMDVISNWVPAPGRSNLYQHLLFHSLNINTNGYSYIMVAEIDTTLEKTQPVSAVRYLTFVSSPEICQNTAGTYYIPGVTTNPTMVSIHPTQGTPGKNKYRYEVTTRDFAINGLYVNGLIYKNLFLQSSSYGYGMLGAGDNSQIKNVVFQGGGIHHLVLKSGELDSTIFLPGAKGIKDRLTMVFYKAQGGNMHNKISNSVFLDVPSAIYAHTDGSIKYKTLTIDKVFAFGDSLDAGNAFGGNDTDSINLLNSYTENYPTGFLGIARKINIANTIFRQTNQAAISLAPPANVTQEAVVKNVLIKSNGNDNNQTLGPSWTVFAVRAPYPTSNIDVSNIIFHGYSTWHQDGVALWTFQVGGQLRAYNNIYICDVNDKSLMNIYRANNSGGIGSSRGIKSDSNVFILARGAGFHWLVEPNTYNDINVNTLEEFQQLTGQDKHSIFIDLRKDPLGLKAIFVDPENGNWSLTQSLQANAIRTLRAGMTTPPLYYPRRPLYDNAITYRTPEGFSALEGTIISENESILRWNTFNEWEVASFDVEYSNDGINFSSAGSVVAKSSGNDHSYEFKHPLPEVPMHFYRLKIVNKDNSIRYSNVVPLTLILSNNEDILFYPNPVRNAVTVEYPRRDKSSLHIYDFSGKLIQKQTLNPQSSRTILYLDHLSNGMYLIKWNSDKEQSLQKFFKHR